MDYVDGDEATNNKHLAEALDMTREGNAPVGSTDYDEPIDVGGDVTPRDSCFFVAIEELQKIDSAPGENQEKIDKVLQMLQSAQHSDNETRARVMAEAHEILQDVWVPPE